LDDRGLRLSSYVEQRHHKRHARNPVHALVLICPIASALRLAFWSKRMKRAAVVIALLVAIGASGDVAAEAKATITPPRPTLYGHVLPRMQEDATVRVDDALQAAINRHLAAIR
jgi:hypothetical protein